MVIRIRVVAIRTRAAIPEAIPAVIPEAIIPAVAIQVAVW
jgi:hypothetical protein